MVTWMVINLWYESRSFGPCHYPGSPLKGSAEGGADAQAVLGRSNGVLGGGDDLEGPGHVLPEHLHGLNPFLVLFEELLRFPAKADIPVLVTHDEHVGTQEVVVQLLEDRNRTGAAADGNCGGGLEAPGTVVVGTVAQAVEYGLETARDAHQVDAGADDEAVVLRQHVEDFINNIIVAAPFGHVAAFLVHLAAGAAVVAGGVAAAGVNDLHTDAFLCEGVTYNTEGVIGHAALVMASVQSEYFHSVLLQSVPLGVIFRFRNCRISGPTRNNGECLNACGRRAP